MICANYQTFRSLFAYPRPSLTTNWSFAAPNILEIAAGNLFSEGFEAGMVVTVDDSATNDFRFHVTEVETHRLVVEPYLGGPGVLTEAANPATVSGVHIANDGWPTYPVDLVYPWVDGSFPFFEGSHSLKPLTIIPVQISLNGFDLDSVNGVDEWDWYVSQRTDDVDKQYLSITPMGSASATMSGSIRLGITDKCREDLGMDDAATTLTTDQLTRIMKSVTIYARKIDTHTIFVLNFLPYTMNF